jgi:hypothetical protein
MFHYRNKTDEPVVLQCVLMIKQRVRLSMGQQRTSYLHLHITNHYFSRTITLPTETEIAQFMVSFSNRING